MGRKKKHTTEEERKQAIKEASRRCYQKHKAERAAYMKQRYADNRETILEQVKQYQTKHKAEITAKQAEYRASHKAEINAYMKQYRADHKAEKAAYHKQWHVEHKAEITAKMKQYQSTPFGRAVNLASNYRFEDKKYNRGKCTITAEWIVDNVFSGQHCHYCGESDWTKLGCDRIDNSKPHTPDNVVCCCGECNTKKHTTPYEEYLKKVS